MKGRRIMGKVERLAVVLGTTLAWGCLEPRAETGPIVCLAYESEVAPTLAASCGSCHGDTNPAADYRVTSYGAVLTPGASGAPPAVAGSADSPLLTLAAGGAGHPAATPETLALLNRFVVDCGLSYFRTDAVHPRGFVNPRDPAFHGKVLESLAWSFDTCAECHGDVDAPSTDPAQRSCTQCHKQGVTACNTCHGDATSPAPPASVQGFTDRSSRGVGAHRAHLMPGPTLGKTVACNECHTVPTAWDDVGHIFLADGSVDHRPAEVSFAPAANRSLEHYEDRRTGPATYDVGNQSCSNVYCHASVIGVTPQQPFRWTLEPPATGCALCHGEDVRPVSHATWIGENDCTLCHGIAADPSLHIDARLSVGNGSRDCAACHGASGDPMPPPGVDGELLPSDAAVGAHLAHTTGGEFMAPLDCNACHVVPTGADYTATVTAHIDSDRRAEVFRDNAAALLPGLLTAEGGTTPLAAADGAAATYDRQNAGCTVYCHGAGESLSGDAAVSVDSTPDWTSATPMLCGSCHGLPPETVAHPSGFTLTQCALCHSTAIDGTGALQFAGDGSTLHLNGVVDFN